MYEVTPKEDWFEREEKRKKLEKEREESFFNLMKEVTEELSNISVQWMCKPRPGNHSPCVDLEAVDPKYGKLYIILIKDKINVSGHYPMNVDGIDFIRGACIELQLNTFSINISSKKTPTQIAVEIDKRFLIDYMRIFRKAEELKKKYIERRNEDKTILEHLCEIGEGKIHKQGPGADRVASLSVGDTYTDISVYCGSVRVERISSLTPEQMEKVILALKGE